MKELPSIEELRERFSYNPETGEIRYRVSVKKVKAGDVAGTIDSHGYRIIQIGTIRYKAHRVAWAMHYGEWPPTHKEVEHKNGGRADNRIANLRLATHRQNGQNRVRPKNNTSGFKGVSLFKRTGKWRASITANGVTTHIGYYPTPEEAHAAYVKAAYDLHGEFANAG